MRFFYGADGVELFIPDGVYYPREDSLLLAAALGKETLAGKKALDMGCGSGFLAVVMAKNGAQVTAADISKDAVKAAKGSAESNGVSIDVLQSDLFSSVAGVFDLIAFNPPYLPVAEDDKTYSGGQTGRDVIERFVRQAPQHLNAGGKVLLLISSLTGERAVMELFQENGFAARVAAREKVPWEGLMVIEAI